jgi:hypothetical protein
MTGAIVLEDAGPAVALVDALIRTVRSLRLRLEE